MKKTAQLLLTIFFIVLFNGEGYSQICKQKKKTYIYYGNGITTTRPIAGTAESKIREYYSRILKEKYPNDNFEFGLSYNYSRGLVKDILEVINQKVDETGGLTAEELLDLIQLSEEAALIVIKNLSTASGGGRIVVEVAFAAVKYASKIYLDGLKTDAKIASKWYEDYTNSEHIEKYTKNLNEGNRVIVIAHYSR